MKTDEMKPNQASIEAAKAVCAYLVREGLYLEERQAEQVALTIGATIVPLLQTEAQDLNDKAYELCRAIEAMPSSEEATRLSGVASFILNSINPKIYPWP